LLRLYNNQLQALPDNFLVTCQQLKALSLKSNQLQVLPANFLATCPKLSLVFLDDNQLQALPDHFLATCPKLELLSLQENQLPIEEVQNIRATLEQLGKKEDVYIKLEPQNKPGKE